MFGGASNPANEVPDTNKDFQTNESLGMDGIDVVLEDYNGQHPQTGQLQEQNQGGVVGKERQ